MATRVVSGVLAIAGAITVVVGGYMPYAQQGKFEFRIFETKAPHAHPASHQATTPASLPPGAEAPG